MAPSPLSEGSAGGLLFVPGRRYRPGGQERIKGRVTCRALGFCSEFYARQGCDLGAVNRYAYPELPDEIKLL